MVALAILSIGIAGTTSTLSNVVYAKKTPNDNDPNEFGKAASDQAKNGDMGDHAKAGGAAGDPPYDKNPITGDPDKPGRSGIGNIGNDLGITCGSKHPADLADVLKGNPC